MAQFPTETNMEERDPRNAPTPQSKYVEDDLDEFASWFVASSPVGAWVPLHGAVHKVEDVYSVLMFREAPYQVQMFIVPPYYIIPEHVHPNVDSIEVYVGGQIRFSHSGQFLTSVDDLREPAADGCAKPAGMWVRVRPNDLHGGVFGPGGGVFFSIQKWLNGVEPHCVAADYEGVVMGPHHLQSVKFGNATLKQDLTVTDAASRERNR